MSGFEYDVRKAVESGQTVDYTVTPVYQGNKLIPDGITIKAIGDGGLNLQLTIINRK